MEPLLRDVILPAEHATALERMKAELGIGGVAARMRRRPLKIQSRRAYHSFYC
jgi:hypothetical protein